MHEPTDVTVGVSVVHKYDFVAYCTLVSLVFLQAVKMLLEAGASPEFVDKVSMESAFDVAQNEEVRAVLVSSSVLMFVLFFL